MNVVYNGEPSYSSLTIMMRSQTHPKLSADRFFQVKTNLDNSIVKCDSNRCILCQDVLSNFYSGDLGFYAFSAKDFINACSHRRFHMSGSSVSEAFQSSLESELARSSSNSGEEVNRAGVDLLMPATPVNYSSVIFNSSWPMGFSPIASYSVDFWNKEISECLFHPSLTSYSGLCETTNYDNSSLVHKKTQSCEPEFSFAQKCAHDLLNKLFLDMGRIIPTKASLNIPVTPASNEKPEEHIQGTNPSFKMNKESNDSVNLSATSNQYALFPTSKNRAMGKLGKFGFSSIRPNMLKLNRWGIPCGLGLLGGGESGANGWGGTTTQPPAWGTGGNNQSNSQPHWGTVPGRSGGPQTANPQPNLKQNQPNPNNSQPPSSTSNLQNSVNTSNQQGPTSQQPQQPNQSNSGGQPVSSGNSWAQTAGKGLPSNTGSSDAQKLQNIKEALLSSEGWNSENVNQESQWDVPASPEPGKDSAVPLWKQNANNGCDLWENNLRNGGVAPPKPQQAPWGQNPITNYGGTWGEDDESSDTSNAWTGGAPANPPQWGTAPNPGMWGNAGVRKKTPDFGPNAGWGEHAPPPRADVGAPDWGPHKPSPHPGQHPNAHPGPHQVPHPGMPHPAAHPPPHQVNPPNPHAAPHGPAPHGPVPHGPAPHGPLPHGPNPHGPAPYGPGSHLPPHNAPAAPGQWGNPPKEKPSGWEEPPAAPGRKDDGTAVWGNPTQQAGVSRWKEMPNPNMAARQGLGANQQSRLPAPAMPSGPNKPDQRMWAPPSRNGSWGDPPHDTGNAMWGDGPKTDGWGDASITSPSWATKPKTPTGAPVGPDQEVDLGGWNAQTKVHMGVTRDCLNNNKEIRTLLELSLKKEDMGSALRGNMGLDESLDLGFRGNAGAGLDMWRSPLEEPNSASFGDLNNPNFPQRFPSNPHQQQVPINSQQSGNTSNQQHIQALMRHIQCAVHNGYLNPQILNQPLAPASLLLLNNMLSQIGTLQKLMAQHSMYQPQSHLNKNSAHHLLQLNVHITKTKQQIQNYQNQIAAQQALYVKSQQQQHHPSQGQQQQPPPPYISGGIGAPPSSIQNELFRTGLPDPLISNFNHMSVNDSMALNAPGQPQPQMLQQGSRWKFPSSGEGEDKVSMNSNDFVRAPGKPQSQPSQSSPNLTPLLPATSSAWSLSNRSTESGGWPDRNIGAGDMPNNTMADKGGLGALESTWSVAQGSCAGGSYGLEDIKPFEPGKQWMVNNIEDDPSITPGSVARSPLALGIKDSDLLTSISKPSSSNAVSDIASSGPLTSLSLSSNPWSFNPGSGHSASPIGSDNKLGGVGLTLTSELWGAPGNKPRGPPPGLNSNITKPGLGGSNVGSWSGLGRSPSWTAGDQSRNASNSALQHSAAPSSAPWPTSQVSYTWLILNNLTPQIDGSTLKTLCLQHGPLINFHLSLNHGFALVNYGSREEAMKAQGNLNNCLLSNTTILAEFASDSEVKHLLSGGGTPNSWGNSGRDSTPTSQSSNNSDSWGNNGIGGSQSLFGNGPAGNNASLWGGSSLDPTD